MSFIQKFYVVSVSPIAVVILMFMLVLAGKLSKEMFYKYAFLVVTAVFPNTCNTGWNCTRREFACNQNGVLGIFFSLIPLL